MSSSSLLRIKGILCVDLTILVQTLIFNTFNLVLDAGMIICLRTVTTEELIYASGWLPRS